MRPIRYVRNRATDDVIIAERDIFGIVQSGREISTVVRARCGGASVLRCDVRVL